MDSEWVVAALLGMLGAALVGVGEFLSMLAKWSKTDVRPPELQSWPPFVVAHVLRLCVAAGVCGALGAGPFGLTLTGVGAVALIRSVHRAR
jgi:hypothetical protein